MKDVIRKWSKKEFHTYLFIYCMNSDFKEAEEELTSITSKTNNEIYKQMHSEFEKDNDYESIQKIIESFDRLNYTKEQRSILFNEIKELFLSDGKYVILERNLMFGLKKILN